jgi:hypothetical protein
MPQNVLDVPLESPSNPTCYYSGYCFGDCTCGYEGQEECDGPELIEGNCYFGYDCTEEGCEHNSTETCPNTKLEDDVCYYDHDCTEEGCEYSQNETCPPFKEEEGFCEFNPICVYQETDLLDSQEVCSYQNSISMDNYTDCTAEGPKDLMPPITSIIGGGYTNLWTNQTDWHIFFQAEDGESWVTDSLWRVNDNNWANVPNSNSENPFEFDKEFTLDEGNHTLEYYSIDYSNNQEETHQRPIKIDLTNPEVNAGPDKSSTGSVNVDATTSDNLSGIETYSWTKESGPGEVTFSNPNQEDTEISADETGTYKIRLTVTDNAGNTNYDELNYEKEKKSSSSGGGPVKRCSPNWECTEWSECSQQGKQIRTCTDLENCRTNRDKPKEEKNCTYEEESEQETEPEQEPVIPEPVIPENNQTGNSTNSTDSNGPEGITGAAIGDIQVNPLGDFFKNFWNWFLNFFNF